MIHRLGLSPGPGPGPAPGPSPGPSHCNSLAHLPIIHASPALTQLTPEKKVVWLSTKGPKGKRASDQLKVFSSVHDRRSVTVKHMPFKYDCKWLKLLSTTITHDHSMRKSSVKWKAWGHHSTQIASTRHYKTTDLSLATLLKAHIIRGL